MYPVLELYPARPIAGQENDMMDLVSMFQKASLGRPVDNMSVAQSHDDQATDTSMSDDSHFQLDSPPSRHPLLPPPPPFADVSAHSSGCAYLEAIGAQLASRLLASDEHLDVLYTHRTLFAVHPSGHVHCAPVLTALAGALEARGEETDRRAGEAFRHEAMVMDGCQWGGRMRD